MCKIMEPVMCRWGLKVPAKMEDTGTKGNSACTMRGMSERIVDEGTTG